MGRHSIPDPEDSAGEDTPAEPPTQRFGRQQPEEPDNGPGHREPGYPSIDYAEGDNDEPGYDVPGHGETDSDEPDYPDADYPEPDEDHAQPQPGRGGRRRPPATVVGSAAHRRMGRWRMDGQPPCGGDRQARRQHRRDRRPDRRRGGGRRGSSCGDSSATRCPIAPMRPPPAVWTANSLSPSSPIPRSPIRSGSWPKPTTGARRPSLTAA